MKAKGMIVAGNHTFRTIKVRFEADEWEKLEVRIGADVYVGDHALDAGKMIDLDPKVQDVVQKNFHALTCPACAESVDCQPGNGACQQCIDEREHLD